MTMFTAVDVPDSSERSQCYRPKVVVSSRPEEDQIKWTAEGGTWKRENDNSKSNTENETDSFNIKTDENASKLNQSSYRDSKVSKLRIPTAVDGTNFFIGAYTKTTEMSLNCAHIPIVWLRHREATSFGKNVNYGKPLRPVFKHFIGRPRNSVDYSKILRSPIEA